ncbi:ABC transporter ATP-binding protein [Bradyrhizobium sp.]|uniref:ABC transporter ATP-binding protein n=1 Tax=Bradyrhizobium sp. TaxID=376 RepID=UPI001EB9C221|nr:ABC transporter ATP-binding protein [Bradyrhizobium sp.]MBV8893172.1 ABC transporter ATP-binding protein [Acidobacteriota bacterium]MBV9982414.1 ABC transporter ATP-binding protein [Bradyrhizobium sp.]
MSKDIAISVRNVSKKFRLFTSPSARLAEALHPFRKAYHREFWALRDVSFTVERGEVLGILGQNGSGKSTLLQIICSVMQATEGRVDARGRLSALLELGAGFNPEFTGRQNVMLNGSIMGFSRKEMQHRMPQIEAFAEVGEFFDQPVKTYSSGMSVRVAFAAAIHIDPEILIIDEALAVGDAKFQHKCYARIENFKAENKTIILVTHDIGQITAHCDRAILMNKGRLVMDGKPRDVVDRYIETIFGDDDPVPGKANNAGESHARQVTIDHPNIEFADNKGIEERRSYCKNEVRFGDRRAEIVDCVVEAGGVWDPPQINFGDPINIYAKLRYSAKFAPLLGFCIKTLAGIEVYGSNTFMQQIPVPASAPGTLQRIRFSFSAPLRPGDYFLDVGVAEMDGTPGGSPVDVRRSVAMISIAPISRRISFNGLFDLSPKFDML